MTRPDPIPGLRDALVDGIEPYERRRVRVRAIVGVTLVAVAVGAGTLVLTNDDETTLDTVTGPDTDADVVEDPPDTVAGTDGGGSDDPTDGDDPGADGGTDPTVPPVSTVATAAACASSALAHDAGLFTNRGGPHVVGVILTNLGSAPCELVVDGVEWQGRPPGGEFTTALLDYSATEPGRDDGVDEVLDPGESAAIHMPFEPIVSDGGSTSQLRVLLASGDDLMVYGGLAEAPAVTQATGLHGVPAGLVDQVYLPADPAAGTPVEPGQVLSTAGLGAIDPGATLQEVADATGTPVWAFEWSVASPRCGHAQLGATPSGDLLLHVLGDSLDLDEAIVTAVVVTTPDFATPSGVRVGDPESRILDLFAPDRLDQIPNEYTDGHIWRFTPENPGEAHLGVAFAIEDGVVVSIAGGLSRDVHRAEGCA